ncbi:thermonuclease family protein [Methylotenera sp.]|uniref:thermonuclease family protein n=1 Tax=Methylotenera sp. TaxID=2051956 RepID=UPI002736B552|nr:thermonuclease family protein [Methylotenera sp.]MDP3211742.1 thermonuclease family protein [Methylotenera sp.]
MTTYFIRHILLSLALSLSTIAHAETITGRVVGVSDGDTLTILDPSNTQFKIRLAAIDAPEKAQPFGQRGKQKLSDLCYGKIANVKVVSIDRYERTVGEVDCADVNANVAMVHSGLAWVYRKYDKGYGHLYRLEEDARNARRGLWTDNNPTPPWEWRKAKRNN